MRPEMNPPEASLSRFVIPTEITPKVIFHALPCSNQGIFFYRLWIIECHEIQMDVTTMNAKTYATEVTISTSMIDDCF